LTLVIMAVDFTTWIQLDVASVYPIPLVLAAGTRMRAFLWLLTLLIVVTTFAVYALQIPSGTFSLLEPFFDNRVLDLVGVVLTAALLHVWIRSVEIREAQLRLLDEKNRDLVVANAELLRREARIAEQNELLDRRRREAEEASGRKTELLAAVSHDIRTPLSSIQLTADVIRRTVSDPELAVQIPGMAQRLHANAASLLEVASELIEVGSYDLGRVECHVSEFELRELVAARCGEVLPLAQAKMLQLEIDAPETPIYVATDRTKLGRIVSNLLTNAVKFTRVGIVRAAIVHVMAPSRSRCPTRASASRPSACTASSTIAAPCAIKAVRVSTASVSASASAGASRKCSTASSTCRARRASGPRSRSACRRRACSTRNSRACASGPTARPSGINAFDRRRCRGGGQA
ncbi:MAG TPA: HAMP domain-containing sensor histidine kinase, partial [Casimicrobiaceae bacterium]